MPFRIRKTCTALLVLAAALVGYGYAQAQAPDPGAYSPVQNEFTVRRGVMVSMRDGTRLAAEIYVPKAAAQLPAILSITPYGRKNANFRSAAEWFASRGYVFAVVDSRGRFDSDGIWDPFDARHKTDGYDLVEWIAAQSWSNGKVGMWGPSYSGSTQWWTASTVPPHLVAIVPQVAPSDQFTNGGPYQNGVLTGSPILDWTAMVSGRTNQAMNDGQGGWAKRRDEDYKHTPYSDINSYRGIENAPWFSEWYRRNRSTDEYWKAIAYQDKEHYSKITVPSLAFTGWFDFVQSGSPLNYIGMKKFGATAQARRPSLVIGPWTHGINGRIADGNDYGLEPTIDLDGYITRWFDHFLKGIDNGVDKDPPVHVFVMGENKWHAEQDWPLPQTQPTKYYFASRGRANSLNGDGLLTTISPGRSNSDAYIYDPRYPTRDPADGQLNGASDTHLAATGDDVLVYQTPPLVSPVEVTGPIEATLYAASSAKDTDWIVRLVDVQPDNRSLLLAEGVMRARNRDPGKDGQFNGAQLSVIEPGRIYQYKISFWRATANLFRTGHRIRVEISSSWFPYYLPNLNTGADNLAMTSISQAVVANQTLYHGGEFPSHILLPIIPPRKPGNQ